MDGIWQSAKQFFSGTLVSRLSGFCRDLVMAACFGITPQVAALLVAFRFAHLFRRLLGEGALQTAFIPQYEALKIEDPEKAKNFFRTLCLTLSCGLTLLVLAAMGVTWMLLPNEILEHFLIFLPSLLFICLYGLFSALLQCEKRYFVAAVAPVAFNSAWIVGALAFRHQPLTFLAGAITCGCLLQWLVTLPFAWKFLGGRWDFSSLKSLAKPLTLAILGVAATQVNTALDALFARYASESGPALLWYAIRLQQLPLALFGIALTSALLPPLSRAAKRGDGKKFSAYLRFAVLRGLTFMVPITVGMYLFGEWGIRLLYERGAFDGANVTDTARCLYGYAGGLTPMALVLLLAPAFYATNDYTTPTVASGVAVGVNIGLNSLFVLAWNLGPEAIAWATSVSAWINLLILYVVWARKSQAYALWIPIGQGS